MTTTLPMVNSLAGQFWSAVLATLEQRGMLRMAGRQPLYPHAQAGIETDRCVIFIRQGWVRSGKTMTR